MDRKLSALAGSLLLVLAVACGGGKEAAAKAKQQARDAEWTELQQHKADLDQKRQRLAELRTQAGAESDESMPAGEAAAGGEPAAGSEEQQLEQDISTDSQAFYEQLVNFINSAEIVVGQELTERQKAAIAMKSDEDILVAQEFIDKGGDYARALEIYDTALQADPDNEHLHQAKQWAEEHRWMTEERFAAVKKGMTRAEVRAVLGQPNLHNIQTYPEKKTVAWFYPKGPDRSAAGIYFNQKGSGPYKVYLAQFNAVKPTGAQGGSQVRGRPPGPP
jgi:tetratricopeptide (TPR) repeat protein